MDTAEFTQVCIDFLFFSHLSSIQECLRVMLVPETFLTAEAHARSQAAGLSLQIAGHGVSVEGSREMSDSLSQQVSQ